MDNCEGGETVQYGWEHAWKRCLTKGKPGMWHSHIKLQLSVYWGSLVSYTFPAWSYVTSSTAFSWCHFYGSSGSLYCFFLQRHLFWKYSWNRLNFRLQSVFPGLTLIPFCSLTENQSNWLHPSHKVFRSLTFPLGLRTSVLSFPLAAIGLFPVHTAFKPDRWRVWIGNNPTGAADHRCLPNRRFGFTEHSRIKKTVEGG